MMKVRILYITTTVIYLFIFSCRSENRNSTDNAQKILRVPSDYETFDQAVKNAESGDLIILAPGTYVAMKIASATFVPSATSSCINA